MNENSAAALYYGLERVDNSTHTVIFYNVGSYNLQVTTILIYKIKGITSRVPSS
jgi:hypoxia up-regulated 1